MKNLFLAIFEQAQAENKLVGIRTNREEPTKFYVGYVVEFNEKTIQLKAVSRQGWDEGSILLKLKDVFGVDFDDRYLRRLDLLYKSDDKPKPKAADSAEPDLEDEDFMIQFLKRLKKYKIFVTVNFEYDLSISGYLTTINNTYFQMNMINDEGDEDGISTYKIEDIQRVFGDGSDQRKAEFFYQNRKKLNK
jgi:hypothetical protein